MRRRLLSRSPDFRRLWIGQGVSDLGSAAGSLAFPLVGVIVLHTSALTTSFVAACSFLPRALLALPMGPLVERRRKRPLMIGADLARVVLLASLPVAGYAASITVVQLVLVALGTGAADLVFTLADQAHLPGLIAEVNRAEAVSVQAGTSWLTGTIGPALGGCLVAGLGAAQALLADAVSFVVSAVSVWRIRAPEPPPPVMRSGYPAAREGMRYLYSHRSLRRLACANALLSWSVLFVSPVEMLFLIRELHASPFQYGVALAAPCLGGFAGTLLARRCAARWGVGRTLLLSGLVRTPWLLVVPLARPGAGGVVLVGVCWAGLLFCAAIYNVTQSLYRMSVCPPEYRVRVASGFTWMIGVGKPIAPLAGGLVAGLAGLRIALVIGGLMLCCAPLLLDRHIEPSAAPAELEPV